MSRLGPRSFVYEMLRRWRARRERNTQLRKLPTAQAEFAASYRRYRQTGVVPADAGDRLFLATWASGGTGPQDLARAEGVPYDPVPFAALDGELFAELDAGAAAAALRDEGYYVAPGRLDTALVNVLRATVDAGPGEPRGDGITGRPSARPDASAPTWWLDPADTLRSPAVRKVLVQRRLADVAGRYLGLDPMIMSLVAWKSYAWHAADGLSAQRFHYDGDRPLFVKMFVYLTDVGPDNGPHVFVPRSHRAKPVELLHGGRLTDDEVAAHYPRESWRTICGPQGTVFFAVTQAFHKGAQVRAGTRSILQINFASDRYGYVAGQPVGSADESPADIRAAVLALPRYFSELYAPR